MRAIEIIRETNSDLSIGTLVRNLIKDFGMSPKYINNGWCTAFAHRLVELLGPKAKIINTSGTGAFPGHAVVEYQGKFYDAESPDGVSDLTDLAYSQRIRRTMNHEKRDNRPSLKVWPKTQTSKQIIQLVTRLHRGSLDSSTIHWLSRFDHYVLQQLPIAMLNLNEIEVDQKLVDEYAQHPTKFPPIIYDGINELIIDGLHRANAADQLGLDLVLAYVGLPEDETPDW